MRYVIIGAGVAGISAVESIRGADRTGDIVMLGDDPHGYYSRPGLAYFLTGELHDKALFPKKREDYNRLKFIYRKTRVIEIDRAAKNVTLENGSLLSYNKLLVATGASAAPLTIPGANLQGVVKLDHLEDARAILKLARRGQTAVVLGGGITALELTEGLLARGMKVHYLLRGGRYWNSVLDEQESRVIEARLQEEGVELHLRSEAIEILGRSGRVAGVRLLDGRAMKCDLLAFAVGVKPRIDLAKNADLACDRGILVNEYLQTNDPDIYAAGDVAQVYDPLTGRSALDSLWSPSREQGSTAGLNMAGQSKAYIKSVPFNVTRLAGLTTTIIGAVGSGHDDDVVGIARGDSETWRQLPDAIMTQGGFDVNRVRLLVGESRLLGAVVMGDQKLSAPLQRIISEKINISAIHDKLLAKDARIADVIVDFWAEHLAAA
ncbi:MAG: NAD(P)/FAD-dependent oxidoreductase [Anaerolineales bacterium]|jgi:NAD(P)H-nitrite reductase large subunit|nr:NAD(P)/FAD-dependent oxidoreductase [Chloroflexota bacterium]MBK6647668.1 NAD(P)/FAD-dependent oxidoreductase [Anaerolineales bacterium]MCC6987051.1 NAD(P)/FAD-dependent oxidoreductase [Anaerolineales bacterium]